MTGDEYRKLLAVRLAPLYIADDQSKLSRARLAWLCDEYLDRSGNLLGWIRDLAFQRNSDEP